MTPNESMLIKQWDSAPQQQNEKPTGTNTATAGTQTEGERKTETGEAKTAEVTPSSAPKIDAAAPAPKIESAGSPGATFALHTAFADPSSVEGSPDRESIEVRCVVMF